MRRFGILLIFVLFLCFARTSEARKLALLVGVDDYDEVPSLKCCVNDMMTLKEALTKIGFLEDDIQLLVTNGAPRDFPTKRKIERRIEEILSQAQSMDTVFFAFSGHGAQEGKNVYFCPPDLDLDDIEGSCVSISKMMDDLAECPAKFKWVVVDACRNDPNSRDVRGFQAVPSPPSGIALFQSCAKGEKSYEQRKDGGNGFFTKNFAAALSGEADANHDGKLTLMEVCVWTTAQTKAEVEKAENQVQRPYFSGSVSDFILTENLNVPKAKALAKKAHEKIEKGEYQEAIDLLDEAIRLCNSFDSWKRERKNAKKLLEAEKRIKKAEQEARKAAKMQSKPTLVVTPSKPTPPKPVYSGPMLQESSPQAGILKVLKDDDEEVTYSFRWCPPGEFMMGGDSRLNDAQPVHRVRLNEGFWLLETEVTQEMWMSVMGYSRNPSKFKGEKNPVENVSWYDCQLFCQKLSKKLRQKVMLPTEAQWEYACRAGTTGNYAGNLAAMAWYDESVNTGSTHPVAQKRANAWGLYDMHGNVWEWCSDYYDEKFYIKSPTDDPENTIPSPNRVVRGGSWLISAGGCTSARRDRAEADRKDELLGFRILLRPSSWD